jgi:uncharacterized protein DUF4333
MRPPVWFAALIAIALLVAIGVVIGRHGSSNDATILNTEKIERSIEESGLNQRGERSQVSCPSGVHQEEGRSFDCTAVVGATSTRFVVTQLDDSGQVHYEAP